MKIPSSYNKFAKIFSNTTESYLDNMGKTKNEEIL